MKIAFIGGNGHFLLRSIVKSANDHSITEVAWAGDGLDDAKAKASFDALDCPVNKTWFDDRQAMYEQFKPAAVNIGVRYGRNGDYIAQALQRDIPVLSDKPVAGTAAQLERLKEITQGKAHRIVLSEFPFRANPAFVAARQAVAEGLIGDVVLTTAQKSYKFRKRDPWYADRADYGGTILWVASHAIDYAHFVTGLNYTSVAGVVGNVSRKDYGSMEEYTANTFTMDNGSAAIVHADFNRPDGAPTHGDDRLRVVGSKGQLEIRDQRCELITSTHGPTDITGRAQVREASVEMFDALKGNANPYYSTHASLQMAAVLLAARDAADQRVTLPVSM